MGVFGMKMNKTTSKTPHPEPRFKSGDIIFFHDDVRNFTVESSMVKSSEYNTQNDTWHYMIYDDDEEDTWRVQESIIYSADELKEAFTRRVDEIYAETLKKKQEQKET